MPHLQEMVAPPKELKIGGELYRFTVLTLTDHAMAAQEMKRQRSQPTEVVKKLGPDLPPDMQAALLEMAYRDERTGRDISIDEILEWYKTPYGCQYRIWLTTRKYHPEMTMEDCDILFQLAESENEAGQLEDINGLPDENPTSPPASG